MADGHYKKSTEVSATVSPVRLTSVVIRSMLVHWEDDAGLEDERAAAAW